MFLISSYVNISRVPVKMNDGDKKLTKSNNKRYLVSNNDLIIDYKFFYF